MSSLNFFSQIRSPAQKYTAVYCRVKPFQSQTYAIIISIARTQTTKGFVISGITENFRHVNPSNSSCKSNKSGGFNTHAQSTSSSSGCKSNASDCMNTHAPF